MIDFTIVNRTGDKDLHVHRVYIGGDKGAQCYNAATDTLMTSSLPLEPGRSVGIHCERGVIVEALADGQRRERVPGVTLSLFTEATAEPIQISLPPIDFAVPRLVSEEAKKLAAGIAALEKPQFEFVKVDQVTVTSKGEKRKTVPSAPVTGPDLCILSSYDRYGGASTSCSVNGDSNSGWTVSASSRNSTSTCTMTCYKIVFTPGKP